MENECTINWDKWQSDRRKSCRASWHRNNVVIQRVCFFSPRISFWFPPNSLLLQNSWQHLGIPINIIFCVTCFSMVAKLLTRSARLASQNRLTKVGSIEGLQDSPKAVPRVMAIDGLRLSFCTGSRGYDKAAAPLGPSAHWRHKIVGTKLLMKWSDMRLYSGVASLTIKRRKNITNWNKFKGGSYGMQKKSSVNQAMVMEQIMARTTTPWFRHRQ